MAKNLTSQNLVFQYFVQNTHVLVFRYTYEFSRPPAQVSIYILYNLTEYRNWISNYTIVII